MINVEGSISNVITSTLSSGITRTSCSLINTDQLKSIQCNFYEIMDPLIPDSKYQFKNVLLSKNPGIQLSYSKWASDLIYLGKSNLKNENDSNVMNVTIHSLQKTIPNYNGWEEFHKNTVGIYGSIKGIFSN